MSISLTGLSPAEIAQTLGLAPFQGRQIFRWIHQKQIFDFARMTDLSKELRERLADACTASQVTLVRMDESALSGTRKALLRLADNETVEAVLIPARNRVTLCLSSQVGCALQCSFCATGAAGFRRNLEAGEIVEQALYLLSGVELAGRTPNVVYMGMGEPFRNYDAVTRSIRLLMDRDGLAIGARKITVSTAGDAKQIERFAQEDWQVRLSVSLHAANDELRSRLVPLNRRYPLARLKDAIQVYLERTGRQITFEWTLLTGVNMAASIHLLCAIDNGGYFEADVAAENPFRDEMCSPPCLVDANGNVRPHEGPGLGVAIDEKFLAAYPLIEGPAYV